MEDLTNNYKHIKGWGIDADQQNEPTYPMKQYTGDDRSRLNYKRPAQQPQDMEILQSNERPVITAAFGTSSPPSGLSGHIRRFAFGHSEASLAHWLPLLIADRVNAIEGIIEDIQHKHIPNIFSERGWGAEVKYNKAPLTKRVVIAVAVTAALTAWYTYNKRKRLVR